MKRFASLLNCVSLALFPVLVAGQAVQVAGLSAIGAGSYPQEMVRVGSNTFFTAKDEMHGRELWVLPDGEPARLVKDIVPGNASSNPKDLTALGNLLYFVATTPQHGTELWVSDGSKSGTYLVSDLNVGPEGSYPSSLTEYQGTIYFSADAYGGLPQLWRLVSGVPQVFAANAIDPRDFHVFEIEAFDPILIFQAADSNSDNGIETWISRGYPHATEPLFGGASNFTQLDNKIFFTAWDNLNHRLWSYDPLSAQFSVHGYPGVPGTAIQSLAVLDRYLYFSAEHPEFGHELWVYDEIGDEFTVLDYIPGPEGLAPTDLTVAGPTLFFVGETAATGRELWYLQHSATGRVIGLAKDINPGSANASPAALVASGSSLYFKARGADEFGPWVIDGFSPNHPRLLQNFQPIQDWSGSSYPLFVPHPNGGVFFAANDSIHGEELWFSDGTATGTLMVADVNRETDVSFSGSYFDFKGDTYFVTFDNGNYQLCAVNDQGRVRLVKEISRGNTIDFPAHFLVVGDYFLFGAANSLWRSDGTEKGTYPIKQLYQVVPHVVLEDGRALLSGNDFRYGNELWITDGTAEGTHLLVDLFGGIDDGLPSNFVEFKGRYFFAANRESGFFFRRPIWSTDGTQSGTAVAIDVMEDSYVFVDKLIATDSALYFSVHDLSSRWWIYRSDGTPQGTFSLLHTTSEVSELLWVPEIERLVWVTTPSGAAKGTVWVSDGTGLAGTYPLGVQLSPPYERAGAYPVRPKWPPYKGNPNRFVTHNGALYFIGDDGYHGFELLRYRPDGELELVLDAAAGDVGTSLFEIVRFNEKLFLSLSDGNEQELWQSDGTAAGTFFVQDFPAIPWQGSSPANFHVHGNTLFFTANRDGPRYELWKLNAADAGFEHMRPEVPPYDDDDKGSEDEVDKDDTGDESDNDEEDSGSNKGPQDGDDDEDENEHASGAGNNTSRPNSPNPQNNSARGGGGGGGSIDLFGLVGLLGFAFWKRRRTVVARRIGAF